MKKPQVLKFWKALANSTSDKEIISEFMNKPGYDSETTLKRYIMVHRGFKEGLSAEAIAKKTSWIVSTIEQLMEWWNEESSPLPHASTKIENKTACSAPPDKIDVAFLVSCKVPKNKTPAILSEWCSWHDQGQHNRCNLYGKLIEDLKNGIPFKWAQSLLEMALWGVEFEDEETIQEVELARKYRSWENKPNHEAFLKGVRSLDGRIKTFDSQKHKNDLLEEVIPELKGIGVFGARESGLSIWYSRPQERRWRISRGWVERDKGGQIGIRLDIEEKLELTYLRQHLIGDEIWTDIEAWKKAMADDINTRLSLLDGIVKKIESRLGLSVSELGNAGEGKGIDIYYAYCIYDHIFSNAVGTTHFPRQKDQFTFVAPNSILLGGQPVIRHPDLRVRTQAIDFFLEAQVNLAQLKEVEVARSAYENAKRETEKVKIQADRIRLTVALPQSSTCDGCRQFVDKL